jgi:hypothetical protein
MPDIQTSHLMNVFLPRVSRLSLSFMACTCYIGLSKIILHSTFLFVKIE